MIEKHLWGMGILKFPIFNPMGYMRAQKEG